MSRTVKAPPPIEALFDKAEEQVSRFFRDRRDDPTKGTIEISDERFVLVRGASLSVEFFDALKRLFAHSEHEAAGIASQVLFDIAHALGKADARHFHKAMGLSDPISKLAPGPIFFSHAGWAFVDISEESKPEPSEDYFLLYDHPYSFEADAWMRAGKHSDFPVCHMNAGYSSGWCEESFGLPLVATEVSCRARGDAACRFIMAPPARIEAHLARHLGHAPKQPKKIPYGELGKSFNRDWTKEALLEKSLQKSERDYRALFDLSPDAILVWNADATVDAANKSAAKLLGYEKAEELIGRNWQDFLAPEERQAAVERIQSLEKPGLISESEFKMRRKDGSHVLVEGRVFVVLDSTGKPVQGIASARDITGRKAAEQAIYLSEARFRSAFESAGHGMALVDLNGRFIKVNAAYCRITGYSEDELLTRSFADITHPDDRAENVKNARRLHAGEIPVYETEKRYIRKDGKVVWVQLNAAVVFDASGAPFHHITQVQDITARKAAEAALLAQALHDPLTGLPNRPAFIRRLHEALASNRRGGGAFAVHYLDLDRFKDINDTLGHMEGDRLLQAVAIRLKDEVRESDFIARFGGDEFAVLQTDMDEASDAGVLAAKLTKSMAAPYRLDGNEIHITVSIGISFCDPTITEPETMLTQADLALYRAKEEGRDRYCFHAEELDREVRERVVLTNELRAAFDNHELELYYQPQVELTSGRIVGMEALVRWNHPRRGLLLPDLFIPLAEKTGTICPLGRWVLDQTCRQFKAWRDQGIAPPRLAVNVSAAELCVCTDFEEDLAENLKRWSIAPGEIEIELTESVLMETTQMHSDALARIERLGATIAIDDFGTGYSSLAYLSAYPVGRLKLAQRFILGIPENADDIAITKVTLSLARELGIKVIAEGVQTKAQLDFLVSAGCLVGQGFYFSKAVPAERATEFLRRGVIEPAAC
ncbi:MULTISPECIES: EAL domain-containing protein [unclassified Bradyrhizobium]|uniref:EAL domain-containing protein n=1 Tax=unclassified Bradyrhizobium TaxID=2631580 RepID=UPI002916C406|nr:MULTISPECIES: EAL domain-containing protein [unclassified Bradyrhizobium]